MFQRDVSETPDVPLDLQQATRVEPRLHSTVQCNVCGNPDVRAVCHHCGKFLCAEHTARPRFYEQPSWEFKGMVGFSQWRQAAHCKEDAHFVFAYRRIIFIPALIGLALVFFPLLAAIAKLLRFVWQLAYESLPYAVWASWFVLAWNQGQQGLILNVVSRSSRPLIILSSLFVGFLIMAVVGRRLHLNREIPLLENHPRHPHLSDIPFAPPRYVLDVVEMLQVQAFVSTAEKRHVNVPSAVGRVTVQAELDHRVQDSFNAYRRRAKSYGWQLQRSVGWDLGFMAMDMRRGVTWTPCLPRQGRAGNLFRLRQPLREIPREIEEGQEQWVKLIEQEYFLEEDSLYFGEGSNRRAILHLVPVLRPFSAARTLIFLFSLPESLRGINWILRSMRLHLPLMAFREGEVDFPVEKTNGIPDPSNGQVRWSRWPLGGLKATEYPYVTLRQPVPTLLSSPRLEFQLEGDGLVSEMGAKANRLWLPTGAPVETRSISEHRKTLIEGEAVLDPLFFSYQKEYAVSESVRLPFAITPVRLREFLNLLAGGSANVIVHMVSQGVPLVAMHQDCSLMGWDVFGRHYAHIYPIDVHLFLASRCGLSGGELDSEVTLTCRALVNSQAEEVQQRVDWLAGKLVEVVKGFADSMQAMDGYH